MLRSKYKKEKKSLISELNEKNISTVMMSVVLKGTSKVKSHFIYECTYLDEDVEKVVPVIAEDMCSAVAKIKPYINKNISENKTTTFQLAKKWKNKEQRN